MSCVYLSNSRVARCLASEPLMVPSILELAALCCDQSTECPIYREMGREVESTASYRKDVQAAGMDVINENFERKASR